MDKKEYITAISRLKGIQRELNDIFFWTTVSVVSLHVLEENKDSLKEISSFSVPSVFPSRKISRSVDSIVENLFKARTTELYKALVVYIVSLVEPVFLEIIRLTLLYDKRRLKIKPNGVDSKLESTIIVDCDNYMDLLNVIISKYINALGYLKPKDQIDYIQKVLSIEIEDDLWAKWIEVKASRDLIVHNKCIINNIYLEKAGNQARGNLGQTIVVDEDYFNNLIVFSKSLVGRIVSKIMKNEKE